MCVCVCVCVCVKASVEQVCRWLYISLAARYQRYLLFQSLKF